MRTAYRNERGGGKTPCSGRWGKGQLGGGQGDRRGVKRIHPNKKKKKPILGGEEGYVGNREERSKQEVTREKKIKTFQNSVKGIWGGPPKEKYENPSMGGSRHESLDISGPTEKGFVPSLFGYKGRNLVREIGGARASLQPRNPCEVAPARACNGPFCDTTDVSLP